MTGRRISSIVLSILGFLSMIAGVIVILWGMQAEPVILREPEKARQCAKRFLKAIDAGSLTEAAGFLADTSALGEVPVDADTVASLVWDTYRTRLDAKAISGLYTTAYLAVIKER